MFEWVFVSNPIIRKSKITRRPNLGDSYQEFLAEQNKGEQEWHEQTRAKKARNEEKVRKSCKAGATADDATAIKLQLESKNRECALLREQLLVQESICKIHTYILHCWVPLGSPSTTNTQMNNKIN